MTSPMSAELPVRLFKDDAEWEAWLEPIRHPGPHSDGETSPDAGEEDRAVVGMLERHEVIHP